MCGSQPNTVPRRCDSGAYNVTRRHDVRGAVLPAAPDRQASPEVAIVDELDHQNRHGDMVREGLAPCPEVLVVAFGVGHDQRDEVVQRHGRRFRTAQSTHGADLPDAARTSSGREPTAITARRTLMSGRSCAPHGWPGRVRACSIAI
jgi:hypothetical protein